MYVQRFDTVARLLARKLPRRRVLAALVGVFGLGTTLPAHALACQKVGKGCDRNSNCCDGVCADLQNDDDHGGLCNVECSPRNVCQVGRCIREGPL